MEIVRVSGMMDGATPLSDRITRELASGKRVLWLVPGGSNIPLSSSVSHLIPAELTSRLTIMLTDERYGEVNHEDSNIYQLRVSGFEPQQATWHEVLHPGLTLEQTVGRYAADFTDATKSHDIIIGQFGMGPDGHLAGILPHSAAAQTADLTYGYETPGFTRITLTPAAIGNVHVAYLFAFGREKLDALNNLKLSNLNINDQPAQIIKQIPESYLYNDQIS